MAKRARRPSGRSSRKVLIENLGRIVDVTGYAGLVNGKRYEVSPFIAYPDGEYRIATAKRTGRPAYVKIAPSRLGDSAATALLHSGIEFVHDSGAVDLRIVSRANGKV